MKKTENGKIDKLTARAFADMTEGTAKSASATAVTPVPEYRLAFRIDERKDDGAESGPELFPFVAAALALFMLVPALFGGSGPTIEQSFALARDSGELVSFTNEFKDTIIRVSQSLRQ